jgi:ribulose bisphosphate carboxylase small subunit
MPDRNKQHSDAGDLTPLANDIEDVIEKHFGQGAAIAVAFSLERSPRQVHWVTNVSRTKGITLFTKTAAKMLSQTN